MVEGLSVYRIRNAHAFATPISNLRLSVQRPRTRCILSDSMFLNQPYSLSSHHPEYSNIMQLPKTQKAAIKQGTGDNATITIKEIPVPEPAPDQILVKINYSGLCASDKSLLHDEWDFKMAECTEGIAGHEGAGIVVAVGTNVQDLWQIGNRAGIKWIASVCRRCEFCTNGQDECHCPKQLNSGFTVAGTFQEYCLTDARYATRLPDGVKDEEAGPIMCGGVTAYVACKRSKVLPGQWIVIPGAGGGEYAHSAFVSSSVFRSDEIETVI